MAHVDGFLATTASVVSQFFSTSQLIKKGLDYSLAVTKSSFCLLANTATVDLLNLLLG